MSETGLAKAANQVEMDLEGQKTLKKVEEMLDLAYDIIPHWPALFRYSQGERIFQLLFEMESLCIAAHLKYFKKTTLQDLDITNHQMRMAVRRARRKSYTDRSGRKKTLLHPGGYEVWMKQSVETGNLIGSWIKSVKNTKKTEQN